MRRIAVEHMKPGMTLAEGIYNGSGVTQVSPGSVLSETAIARIRQLGISHVFIEDPRTDDLVIRDAVPWNVAARGRELLRDFEERVREAGGPDHVKVPFDDLLELVHDIEDGLQGTDLNVLEIPPVTRPEDYRYAYPINVAALSMFVTAKAGLPRRTTDVGLAALLLDIGMELAPEEPEKHPEMSLAVLRQDERFSAYSRAIVFQHEERHDGSGYPRGIAGDDIDPLAKIVSVADMYCSLISEGNPMGERLAPQEAFDYVTSAAGFEFERTTVLGVMQYVALYPVGTMVRLNTGECGVVTRVYKGLTTRPTVRVLYGADGVEVARPYEMVLAEPEHQTVLVAGVCED
ncbi:MAG TPA: HD domain-containing phosphohydrolase [Bacillota bacterium]|jgi:hypothetical protein|nr:HD domain-containing phosphohydrolase [Bacillota bacterium]